MSINDDDDPLLKLHESLKDKEDDTVSISSEGEISAPSQAFMNAKSLKEALQTLVKYAKQLEEKDVDTDTISEKMLDKAIDKGSDTIHNILKNVVEDDVSDKD